MSSRKTEVVIVGGGSGATFAATLSAARAQFDPAKHNLTLVTQLPYNIHLLATARMAATAEGALDSTDKVFIPYDKLFKAGNAGRVVQGRVTRVEEGRVVLENGSSVSYDYLVLATGSIWTGVTDFSSLTTDEQVHAHVDAWRKKIDTANSIVVVGGGAVGIELVGELKHFHPNKVVTLVHAGDKLLNPAYPDKFRDRVKARLEAAGVNILVGDRVLDIPNEGVIGQGSNRPASLRTTNGVTLEADLFIPALGPRPNTALLSSYENGAALSTTGHVRVSPTLNVKLGSRTLPNVFAMGDIIEWNEQPMLMKAGAHSAIVLKNLLAAVNSGGAGAAAVKGVEYKSGREGLFITVGPKGGVGFAPFLWGIVLGDWVVSMIKSGTLFVPYARSLMGQPKK